MSSIVLYTVTFGLCAGVIAESNLLYGLVTACILFLGIVYFGLRGRGVRIGIAICMLFCAIAVAGYGRAIVAHTHPPQAFNSHLEKVVTVSGIITNDPVNVNGSSTFILDVGSFSIRAKIKTEELLAYDDTVTISGKLVLPEDFLTDQGTTFEYVAYLAKDSIFYLIQSGTLVSRQPNEHFSLKRTLYAFRHRIESKLYAVLPKRESGFVAGILLGTKADIDPDLYNALVRTSTVHIIALSGYNVTIVAETISAILSRVVSSLVASVVGGVGIILFVIMTGASSTALRAGLMALLLILSRQTGRPTDALRVMAIAAVALILYNPHFLTADVSFQLSYLATLGLILVSPHYVTWLERFIPYVFAELIGTTLAAETAVAPFILYTMGIFSVISLPTNILILPFIPLLMLLGFIVICAGFVLSGVASVLGYPTYLVAKGIIEFISYMAALPFASVTIKSIPLIVIVIFYCIVSFLSIGFLTNTTK